MANKFYIYKTNSNTLYGVMMDQSLMALLKDANGANLTDGHGSTPPVEYATLAALQIVEAGAVAMPSTSQFVPRTVTLTVANLGSISIICIDPVVHLALEPTVVATPIDTGHASTAHIFAGPWAAESFK